MAKLFEMFLSSRMGVGITDPPSLSWGGLG
jgi:hypothetical protein